MTFNLATYVITEEVAKIVWECLNAKSEFTSKKKFVEGGSLMLERVHLLPDARSREIVGDALSWAVTNPENFTTHIPGKGKAQGHSPNFVAFAHIMDGLERFSKSWDRPIREIVHDEQDEFRNTLQEWHGIWSGPDLVDVKPIAYPGDEPHSLSKAPGSIFRMSSEDQSAGLQVIDVIIWLLRRVQDKKQIGPECGALLRFVMKRGRQNDFSFAGVGAFLEDRFGKVFSTPLTPEQQTVAEQQREQFEAHRRRQMQKYSEEKAKKRLQ